MDSRGTGVNDNFVITVGGICSRRDAGRISRGGGHLLRMRMCLGLEALHVRDRVRLRLCVGVRLRLQAVRLHRRRLRLLRLHVPQQPGLACPGLLPSQQPPSALRHIWLGKQFLAVC